LGKWNIENPRYSSIPTFHYSIKTYKNHFLKWSQRFFKKTKLNNEYRTMNDERLIFVIMSKKMIKKNNNKRQIRCLNCLERFAPLVGASTTVCPKCKIEWRLTWLSNTSVKVRGPVW